MPKITDRSTIPKWLQDRLPRTPAHGPSPEAVVYLISQEGRYAEGGLWAVVYGYAISIETEEFSVDYNDLNPGSPIRDLIEAETRGVRDRRNVYRLYEMVIGYGGDIGGIDGALLGMRIEGRTDREIIRYLAGELASLSI